MRTDNETRDADTRPHVVIVGGGFGGLYAANALRRAPVRVTVIDRTNHSVFFPLLYQVATAGLSADEIASPIRTLLRRQRNAEVRMAEVTGVDSAQRAVLTSHGAIAYDYLILATGTRYSYFGRPEWQRHAPSLKSIAEAATIRDRILRAFERAELSDDPQEIQELLTFVLVGGGPTGVEMAGAIAELARTGLADEFRRIDPRQARIVLLEAGPRILSAFPEDLARKSLRALERMGVEVRTGATVTDITAEGVAVGPEWIASRTVIWTAGVVASPAGAWLRAETDRIGRVKVAPDLSVPGQPDIFVVGDAAYVEQDGRALPGVAQVALQEGAYAAKVIRHRVQGKAAPKPFRYWDPGNMATVGRAFAIGDFGWLRTSGFLTWLFWLALHVYYLSGLRNQLQVLLQWTWAYFTYKRNVRVLGAEHHAAPADQPALAPAEVPVSRGR
ncbi:MAG TPA: NAD(P)/FAD-dependent oxidoreductase [Roseiflexaceae bacterium]|nr:NAD(P)/FAD-dependent oxidoreductase [Roseiflexaceae bacterium]